MSSCSVQQLRAASVCSKECCSEKYVTAVGTAEEHRTRRQADQIQLPSCMACVQVSAASVYSESSALISMLHNTA